MSGRQAVWHVALVAGSIFVGPRTAAAKEPPRVDAGAPAGALASAAPMRTAKRTSGVAPLAVFFDAVDDVAGTVSSPTFAWTSGVHQPADGDFEAMDYAWDFGDGAAGAWSTTGLSRNRAAGYTAAHVYETPGTYTASLTVTARTGAVYAYQQTISVVAFGGTTYYVAANGDDANAGTSERAPFATVARGFAAVNGGSNRRLLIRRGDVFTTPGVLLSVAGPGIVGAYGTGARPVLNVIPGTGDGISIRAADWRVMDLELVYPTATTHDPSGVGFVAPWTTVDTLILRVKTTGFRVGILNTEVRNPGNPHDGDAFVECEVAGAFSNGMYVGGRRIAVLGCNLHDPVISHVLRMWQGHKAVVSNNRLWNPGATRHAFKFHGPGHDDGRAESRWVTISDNLVRGKTWAVAIAPQDKFNDERVSHVVYERNRHWSDVSVQVDLGINARDVMVRNNVFDGSGAARSYEAILVRRRGIEPAPDRVRVLHNTIVRNDAGVGSLRGVDVQSGATNVTVRGNLVAAPGVGREGGIDVDSAAAGAGLVATENLLVTPVEARFTDVAAGDFSLRRGSPAIDKGSVLPEVRTDHLGVTRPRGRAFDLGAFESR